MNRGWRGTDSSFERNDAAPTSRAMNVTATEVEVTALCAKHNATISAIEPLLSGGTRLVMANADDAAVMRKALKAKLIAGDVVRTMWVRGG